MDGVDLNLLRALDALLAEGSVVAAARRLGLSTSAMSRTLTRLRETTGDPLLVRAGRRLVPTPRALESRDRVHTLAREVHAVLGPSRDHLDLARLERIFTIRANEGFTERFAPAVVAAVGAAAPRVRLRFTAKPAKLAGPLRDGDVDIEIGVAGSFAPEVRGKLVHRDRFVGAVRIGHPLLSAPVTPERYAACGHVVASRRGAFTGPVDEALDKLGLCRAVMVVVPGFSDALRVAAASDLIALAPRTSVTATVGDALKLETLELPVPTPPIAVSAMWHPRMDADAGHRWFRETVAAACRLPTAAA